MNTMTEMQMSRQVKLDKIDAEIARMEVESELLEDKVSGGGGVGHAGLGASWFPSSLSLFSPSSVAPEVVVSERATFLEKMLGPALIELGYTGLTPVIVDGSELNSTFSLPSKDQPQAAYSMVLSGSVKPIFVLLYVNSGGVSYTVAKPTAASGKSIIPTGRSNPYRLTSSAKGAKGNFTVQIATLVAIMKIAISK